MKKALVFLAAAALLGCGSTVVFTRTGSTLPPKPAACEVAVLTAPPAEEPYEELGTIDIQYSSQTAWIQTAEDFKKRVQPLVCQAGGDAAIGRTNDYGVYLKATVLSLHPAPSAPAQKAPSAPAESGGEAVTSDKPL